MSGRSTLDPRVLPVLAVTLLAGLALSLGYLWNEDLGWYLASGDRILAERGLPHGDDFLDPPAAGGEWIAHSWLWTVVLALVRRQFGTTALAVLGALVTAAVLLGVFLRARLDRLGLINGLLAASVLVAGGQRWLLRADIASWALLVVLLVLLERPAPCGAAWLGALAVLHVVWANVHGGFLIGIGAVAAYAVGGWWTRDPGRLSAWAFPVAAAASLLRPRPLATDLGRAEWGLTTATASPIMEWRPTFFFTGSWEPWLWGAGVAIGVAGFVGLRSPRKASRFLLFAGTAVLGALALRFVVIALLVAALVTALNLGERGFRGLAPRSRAGRAAYGVTVAAWCSLVAACAAGTWLARADFETGQSAGGPVSLGPTSTAPGAVRYILEHDLPGPLLNDTELGGYLIDRLHPRHRPFIDSRNLDMERLRLATEILVSEPAWRAAQAKYGFRTVVLSHLANPTPLPLRAFLQEDPAWRRVYLDPQASIFVRRDAAAPPERSDPAGTTGTPYLATGPAWSVALRRAATRVLLRLDSDALLVHYLAVLGDVRELEALDRLASDALAARPGQPLILGLRGTARLIAGDAAAAARDLAQAVAARPEDADLGRLLEAARRRAAARPAP